MSSMKDLSKKKCIAVVLCILDDWNIADKSGMWKFQKALEDLHFKYWVEVFFTFRVSPDLNQSDIYVLQVSRTRHRPVTQKQIQKLTILCVVLYVSTSSLLLLLFAFLS